jgi:serine-type D-Ala-D-Ala carboxypeptidase
MKVLKREKLWRFPCYAFLLLFFINGLLISCSGEVPDSDIHHADEIVETAIHDSLIPGAVLLAGSSDSIFYHKAFGHAVIFDKNGSLLSEPIGMTTSTLFDIASLTKIFATTYGIMLLHSRGQLDLDEPVSNYLPELDSDEKRSITVRHLLSHTSGLLQWYPTYYNSTNKQQRLQLVSNLPLNWPVGEQRRYSDIGFMILADLIESITNVSMDQFLNRNIYNPLELTATVFNPDLLQIPKIAATSHGNPFEKRMVYDDNFGYTIDIDPDSWDEWRDYVLHGEVNDGNAYYTHQGVAGHAGLFSTAREIYRLTALLLNNGLYKNTRIFNPDSIEQFLEPDSYGHGLGFMMDSQSLHARQLPEGSFGHTGFTGTYFVVIPDNDLIIILLTNRQHFGVDEETNYPDLRKLRSDITDLFLSIQPE